MINRSIGAVRDRAIARIKAIAAPDDVRMYRCDVRTLSMIMNISRTRSVHASDQHIIDMIDQAVHCSARARLIIYIYMSRAHALISCATMHISALVVRAQLAKHARKQTSKQYSNSKCAASKQAS
jgi:hypothetical protein